MLWVGHLNRAQPGWFASGLHDASWADVGMCTQPASLTWLASGSLSPGVVEVPGPCVVHVAVPGFPRAARLSVQAHYKPRLLLSHRPKQAKSRGQRPGVEKGLCLSTGAAVRSHHKGQGNGRGGTLWPSPWSLTTEKAAIRLPQRTLGRLPRRRTSEQGVSKGRVTSALTGTVGQG